MTESDRLRAELAETRAELHGATGAAAALRDVGDALADGLDEIGGWDAEGIGGLIAAWRSLRGSVPAPDRAGDDEPREQGRVLAVLRRELAVDTAAPAAWPDDVGAVLRDLRDDLTAFRVQCREDGDVLRAVGVGDALDMLAGRIARHPRRSAGSAAPDQDGDT